MIDKPEKTRRLLATLTAALPFELDLTSEALAALKQDRFSGALQRRQIVSEVSYAGDEGGVMCHVRPENEPGIVTSIAQGAPDLPFAAAVVDYQRHRVKKLVKLHAG
jgi:hypothetical protein